MSNTNTGGPAFPATQVEGGCDGIGKKDGVWHFPGMTLRDYFAAKAMQAILSDGSWHGHTCKTAALESYEMADAMLRAREET
jgi:hypothetical protein